MLSTATLKTPIFERAIRITPNKLSSPFAKDYNVDDWRSAMKAARDNERDLHLCLAALFFGEQVHSLRTTLIGDLFKNISKRSVLTLAVGSANRNFFALQADFREKQRKHPKDKYEAPLHLMDIGNSDVRNAPQKHLSSDDLVAAIVDALPHWFFEAKELGHAREPLETDFGALERRAGMVLSIEAGLGDLWQSALWEGRRFKTEGSDLVFGPMDRESAYYWFASQMRTEAALWGPFALFHEQPAERKDVAHVRSVSVSLRHRGQGRLTPAKPSKRKIQNLIETLEVLEHSYLRPFLDQVIEVGGSGFSHRILVKALWVIATLGTSLQSNLQAKDIKNFRDAKEFSLRVR